MLMSRKYTFNDTVTNIMSSFVVPNGIIICDNRDPPPFPLPWMNRHIKTLFFIKPISIKRLYVEKEYVSSFNF